MDVYTELIALPKEVLPDANLKALQTAYRNFEANATAENASALLKEVDASVRVASQKMGSLSATDIGAAATDIGATATDIGSSATDIGANAKGYVDSTGGAGDNGSVSLGIKEGANQHLIDGELGTGAKAKRGVIGGHNLEQFNKILTDEGFDIDDCIINIREHPQIEGIYEIEYRIPARRYGASGELEIIENQYKAIPNPKTVYDPNVIPDDVMFQWGLEAMAEAQSTGRIDGRHITGYANNGLKFEGYINLLTGEITNFYPVVE